MSYLARSHALVCTLVCLLVLVGGVGCPPAPAPPSPDGGGGAPEVYNNTTDRTNAGATAPTSWMHVAPKASVSRMARGSSRSSSS